MAPKPTPVRVEGGGRGKRVWDLFKKVLWDLRSWAWGSCIQTSIIPITAINDNSGCERIWARWKNAGSGIVSGLWRLEKMEECLWQLWGHVGVGGAQRSSYDR